MSVEIYVDNTFVIQEEEYKNVFFQHINSIDDNIKYTAETNKADGSMPFLDTLVTPQMMEAWQPQCTEIPLTPINICSGTATMPYLKHTSSSSHSYTGPKTFVPTNSYWNKNKQKYRELCQHANILIGQLTG